jgi:hypothetical protein
MFRLTTSIPRPTPSRPWRTQPRRSGGRPPGRSVLAGGDQPALDGLLIRSRRPPPSPETDDDRPCRGMLSCSLWLPAPPADSGVSIPWPIEFRTRPAGRSSTPSCLPPRPADDEGDLFPVPADVADDLLELVNVSPMGPSDGQRSPRFPQPVHPGRRLTSAPGGLLGELSTFVLRSRPPTRSMRDRAFRRPRGRRGLLGFVPARSLFLEAAWTTSFWMEPCFTRISISPPPFFCSSRA